MDILKKYYLYIILVAIVGLVSYLIYRQYDKKQHKLSLKASKVEVLKHYYNLDSHNPIIDSLEYGSIKRFIYTDPIKIQDIIDQINNAEWIGEYHPKKGIPPKYTLFFNDTITINFNTNKVFRIYDYFEYELEDSLKLP
jgi:glycerophosphoryl diester phosphodiesterase